MHYSPFALGSLGENDNSTWLAVLEVLYSIVGCCPEVLPFAVQIFTDPNDVGVRSDRLTTSQTVNEPIIGFSGIAGKYYSVREKYFDPVALGWRYLRQIAV